MANYVGIAGSYLSGADLTSAPSPVGSTMTSYDNGRNSYNGIMAFVDAVNPRAIRMRDITDGTSNTMMIGEQSNYSLNTSGNPTDYRTSNYNGAAWSAGLGGTGTSGWMANVTTVRLGINAKDSSTGNGNKVAYGGNTLITSPHTGGAQFLLGDGSSRFISENINMGTLTRLCDRSDGQVLGEF